LKNFSVLIFLILFSRAKSALDWIVFDRVLVAAAGGADMPDERVDLI